MVELLVSLLVLLLIISLAYWAIQQIPLPNPVRVVAIVVLAIIGIIVLLRFIPLGHLS